MRLVTFALFTCIATLTACGDDNTGGSDNEPFDTFQDCWDDHHGGEEGFSVQDAIKICCLDHPIGGATENTVCGNTAAACMTYVGANLTSAEVMANDVTAACAGYIEDRSK